MDMIGIRMGTGIGYGKGGLVWLELFGFVLFCLGGEVRVRVY